jgi:hypothetical protein
MQQALLRDLYQATKLHDVTSQITAILIKYKLVDRAPPGQGCRK